MDEANAGAGATLRSLADDSQTLNFLMSCYKVMPCTKRYRHDWSVCVFSHKGEMAARRDPRLYLPIFCFHSKQRLPCPRGDACPYAHSLFEYYLHPMRFRTELCQFGAACTRPVCFFAHTSDQLRETGAPGGPQPVVGPPEPLSPLPAPHAAAPGGGEAGPLAPHDRALLSSISEAAAAMRSLDANGAAAAAATAAAQRAISDVLPIMGGGGSAAQLPGGCGAAAWCEHLVMLPAGGAGAVALPGLAQHPGDLRRCVSDSGAYYAPAPPPQQPRPRRVSAAPQQLEQGWDAPPAAGGGAASAPLEQLQRQLMAIQLAAASDAAAASAPLPGFGPSARQMADVDAFAALRQQQQQQQRQQQQHQQQQQQLQQLQHQQHQLQQALAQFDMRVPPPPRTGSPGSAPGSPLTPRSGTHSGLLSAPASDGGAATPQGRAAAAAAPLLMIGDQGLGAEVLRQHLELALPQQRAAAAAPPQQRPPRPPRPAPPAQPGGAPAPMGRDAAAALLAQLPDTAVADLLRALAQQPATPSA